MVGGTVTAIWTAKDANDNPVTGLNPDAPSLSGAAAVGSTASGWTDNGDGTGLRRFLSALRRVN